MNSFIFHFMIYEATRYTRYQSYWQHEDETMKMKSKLYLRIILLVNYMMEKNLFFVYSGLRRSLYCSILILHNPIKLLNVFSTSSFLSI